MGYYLHITRIAGGILSLVALLFIWQAFFLQVHALSLPSWAITAREYVTTNILTSIGCGIYRVLGDDICDIPPVFGQSASVINAFLERDKEKNEHGTTTAPAVVHNTYPVRERIIERPVITHVQGMTTEQLSTRFTQLENALRSEISSFASASLGASSSSGQNTISYATTPSNFQAIAYTQKIDRLTDITLTNATVSGVSGLTDSDIPNSITASNYLPLSGGALTGNLTSTGNITTTGTITAGTLTVTSVTSGGAVAAPYFTATSTTATSTLAGGLTVGSTGFVVDPDGGRVGIATTSPGTLLSLGNTGNDTINISTTATSTFGSGINIRTGCFAVNGTCISGGGGGAFTSSGGYTTLNTASDNVGLGTSSPYAKLSVVGETVSEYFTATSTTATSTLAGGLNIGSGGLVYDYSTGNVGIGNISSSYKLDVAGDINIDQYSGYKQAGNTILLASTTNYSTLVGNGAGANILSSGLYNTALGYQALNAAISNDYNTAVGYSALANTTGSYNTALGTNALYSNIAGSNNTANGYASLYSTTNGSYNTALGTSALYSNTTGSNNTANGYASLNSNTTGSNNTANGYAALYFNTTGSNNTANGYHVLRFNASATSTTAIGYRAGYGVSGQSYSQNNVFVGYQAGYANTTGSNNTLIGYQAGDNITTGGNNIILGYNIDAPNATDSNILNIGNLIFGTDIDGTGTTLSSGNVGIGTTSPWRTLSVNGTAAFTALTNDGTGYYACVNASTGELATSTTACGASSERYKENIQTLTYGLDTINQLRPVSFDWKEDFISNGRPQIGFIAEEVEPVIKEVIGYLKDGTIANLDYPKLTAVIVAGVQELSGKVETLWEKVTGHEERISELEAEIAALKNQINSTPTTSNTTSETNSNTESDTTPPTITILGNNPARIDIGATYADPGATATDDTDATPTLDTYFQGERTISPQLDTSTSTTYEIEYRATDDSGNTTTVIRTVIVGEEDTQDTSTTTPEEPAPEPDTTAPEITLNGSETIELTEGDTFTEPGYSATDDTDGDITSEVAVGGDTVDTATAGTYTITYNVSDTAGNAATEKTRTVTVVAAPEPEPEVTTSDTGTTTPTE